MASYEINYKKNDMIHFHKINIFGDEGVGKTSLISFFENYNNENYELERNTLSSPGNIRDSINNNPTIVEKIRRLKIEINEKKILHLNIYETNLNKYDSINMNLDTLLVQTECIILMWDNNDPETFNNIPKLIDTIESGMKYNKYRKVPIFLIQNKMDLQMNNSIDSRDVEELEQNLNKLKKENSNIIFKKMSLLDKNNKDEISNLILDINRNLDYQENNLNNEVIDSVNFKYPFKMNKNNNNNEIIIALLGKSATGKTSFIYNLREELFDKSPSPTIGEEVFNMFGEIYNEELNIGIIDTAGQERFKSLISKNYKIAHAFLLFFDVTNRESFNDLDYYIEQIRNNNSSKEIILLGNKIDQSEKRIVKKQEAKEKAEQLDIKYFEISCLLGINILEVLNEIAIMSFNRYKKINNDNNDNNDNNNINDSNINDNNNIIKNNDITNNDKENNNIDIYNNNRRSRNFYEKSKSNNFQIKTEEKQNSFCCIKY